VYENAVFFIEDVEGDVMIVSQAVVDQIMKDRNKGR
jgi:hypothetical protein